MSEEHTELVEEYSHGCRVVREDREGEPVFYYEAPLGRVQTFASEVEATLYADVQELLGGFREEKTGERGAPPTVARSSEELQMAYYVANPTTSVSWVAGFYDTTEEHVRAAVEEIRQRAAKNRGGE